MPEIVICRFELYSPIKMPNHPPISWSILHYVKNYITINERLLLLPSFSSPITTHACCSLVDFTESSLPNKLYCFAMSRSCCFLVGTPSQTHLKDKISLLVILHIFGQGYCSGILINFHMETPGS